MTMRVADVPRACAAALDGWVLGALLLGYAAPALLILARESWTSEAGSLAPLILVIGVWSVAANAAATHRDEGSDPGKVLPLGVWAVAFTPITLAYFACAAIGVPTGVALFAWLGVLVSLPAWYSVRFLWSNLIPVAFMALIIPLPYTLATQANAFLRHHVAEQATQLARTLGLDAALGTQGLVVGPYALTVENACAGVSTTVSLVAIGLLFAFFTGRRSLLRAGLIALFAVPIALGVNVLRVVALLALVQSQGPYILDTAFHPALGLLAFVLAAILLAGVHGLGTRFFSAREAGDGRGLTR